MDSKVPENPFSTKSYTSNPSEYMRLFTEKTSSYLPSPGKHSGNTFDPHPLTTKLSVALKSPSF